MKKYLLLLAVVGFMCSCNSDLENKAKKQMKETMLELAKNPDEFKITNVKTILSNDSICVLSFMAKGQNGFGGYSATRYEYYYLKQKDKNEEKTLEYVKNLDDENPLKKTAEDFLRKCEGQGVKDVFGKKQTKEEKLNDAMYLFALTNCVAYGREVEE